MDLGTLDDHQVVNVAAMTLSDGFGLCVFDEQGAGKTVTTIFAFDVLVERNEADFMLIVAPKSMVAEWPEDFARFRPGLHRVERLSGNRKAKRAILQSRPDILVTNFETVVSMEEELRAVLRRHGRRGILTVDESFYVKNLDARRTQAIRRVREHCGRAFVLCGTPAPNSAHDIVEQFSLVDFGTAFAGVHVPKDRADALPVVRDVIAERGVYLRHLKADVLPDLPPKSLNRVLVRLEPEQQELYDNALTGLVRDLEETSDEEFQRNLVSFFARRSALLQICSNPGGVSRAYSGVPAKLKALEGILKELVERKGEKVVVWCFYTASLQAVMDRFQRYNPVRYDGSVSDLSERRTAVRRFQEDDETMLFVANPAAAGAGLTLHRARYAVYESLSNQAAHYLQSLDRIHRRGQARAVEYLVLLSDGTIEVSEFDRIAEKERAAQELLGDHTGPAPTRVALLEEAMSSLRRIETRRTDRDA
ncbi:MAG: DEAD/DEAH box helicase [Planctomycetes bacterium]|nr:DEAD/DEAH box helicase [Planctomycetota bacterium]